MVFRDSQTPSWLSGTDVPDEQSPRRLRLQVAVLFVEYVLNHIHWSLTWWHAAALNWVLYNLSNMFICHVITFTFEN